MKRFTKHLISLGLKIIAFVVGYGINFLILSVGLGTLIQSNYFGIYTEQAKYIIPLIPTAGVIFLVIWVLNSAAREPKCPHCNKRLYDEIQKVGSVD